MPKAKASAVNGAPKARKPRAPKAHKLPDPFPCGEILQDNIKKQWRLGNVIGQGGFGLIYMASDNIAKDAGSNAAFVVKVEPLSNGPLFCELHFYQRAAKPDLVDNWKREKKLKYLGVPKLLGAGIHDKNGMKFRFLVIPRFSTDLQKIFESNGRCLPHDAVYSVGLRMIESLEYLHDNCYVHADIKGANLLLGYNSGHPVDDEVYLVDYGLAYRYVVDGVHKEYKEDPRKAHDGTIEYTSRDAHNGVTPSRRGDLEILGYCMMHWMSGKLPWESNLENKDFVQAQKIKYMNNIPSFIKECFPKGDAPVNLSQFLTYVNGLDYHARPNYDTVKRLFQTALSKLGRKDNGKVFPLFETPQVTSPSTKRRGKRKSDEASDTSAIKQARKTPPAKQTKKPSTARKRPVHSPARNKVVASPKAKVTPSRKTVKESAKKGHAIIPGSTVGQSIIPGAPGSTVGKSIIPGAPNKAHTPRSKLTKAKNDIENGLPKGRNSPAQATAASRPKAATRRRKRTIADVTDAAIQTSPGLGRYT